MIVTEVEWLASTDRIDMIHGLLIRGCSYRKLRLFGCACCRRIWHLLGEERATNAVQIAELYADGLATEDDRRTAEASLEEVWTRSRADPLFAALLVVSQTPYFAACGPAETAAWAIAVPANDYPYIPSIVDETEYSAQCPLVRDIFGNPFRPVTLDPSWLTSTAIALAEQMYDSRDFGAMPILADALQDAGCMNAAILDHCRGAGPHVRGCWVIDLLLGKE